MVACGLITSLGIMKKGVRIQILIQSRFLFVLRLKA